MLNKYLKIVCVAALVSLLLCSESIAANPSCRIAQEALTMAEGLRGLKIKKPVPCTLEDKEAVLAFLKETVQKKIPKEKLEGEERLYKALGFIPQDFDYVGELLKLYADQVGGYYDPEAKRYVMAAWLPDALQPTIAVHELTHALQDQHFNIKNLMDDARFQTDELLAHSALVEGDATAVMNEYQLGYGALAKMPSVDRLILQTVLGSYMTQGLSSAPEGIKNSMIFPYTSGLRFVHYFLRKGGYKEVDRLFRNPPSSTAEILHPELYPQHRPLIESAPTVAKYKDTLGEFFVSTWLGAKVKDMTRVVNAAAGLLNDSATISDSGVVTWLTLWKSDSDAREFFDTVKSISPFSAEQCDVSKKSGDRLVSIVCQR